MDGARASAATSCAAGGRRHNRGPRRPLKRRVGSRVVRHAASRRRARCARGRRRLQARARGSRRGKAAATRWRACAARSARTPAVAGAEANEVIELIDSSASGSVAAARSTTSASLPQPAGALFSRCWREGCCRRRGRPASARRRWRSTRVRAAARRPATTAPSRAEGALALRRIARRARCVSLSAWSTARPARAWRCAGTSTTATRRHGAECRVRLAGLHYSPEAGFRLPTTGRCDAGTRRGRSPDLAEGKAWLVERMVERLGQRIHPGASDCVDEGRHEVAVELECRSGASERWSRELVVATTLFVAARCGSAPAALERGQDVASAWWSPPALDAPRPSPARRRPGTT